MRGPFDFSESDEVAKFISENDIRILNLCHISQDGRLKTLSFSTQSKTRVHDILELGERVDGSNLLPFIEPGNSDIYIAPRLERAFLDPFSMAPTLNLLCDYLDENGKPLDIAPKTILAKAEEKLRSSTGIVLMALAELEFYIIANQESVMPPLGEPDKNYHESSPFTKFEDLRNEALITLDSVGIDTKYGHSEVGRIFSKDNILMEQHEVEFTPRKLGELADAIAIAKWIIRNVCAKNGVSASFSPKISLTHPGNGMHIHLCGLRNQKNIVANTDGTLSRDALKMIGGILKFAPSLAAFGNTQPASYLRFIAHKESPMHICWSARNRLALIRIPLWWSFKGKVRRRGSCKETFEYRAPDAFADAPLLFAGMTLAVDHGLGHPKASLKIAEESHAEGRIHDKESFEVLPRSCSESGENLERDRRFYEADDIFPRKLIDKTIRKLRSFRDEGKWEDLMGNPEEIDNILKQYLHYA